MASPNFELKPKVTATATATATATRVATFPFSFLDPNAMFENAIVAAEIELMNKTSGYVWFNHNGEMSANLIIDVVERTIRVTNLENKQDHFAFKNRLHRFVRMVEKVGKDRGMNVSFEDLCDLEDMGYLSKIHSYNLTRKKKATWSDEQVRELDTLYEKLRSVKWEVEKFMNKNMHDVHCVKVLDGQDIQSVINPMYDDSPPRVNIMFDDYD